MRILIIDQCSGSKDYPESTPVYTADDIDEHGLQELRSRDESAEKKARSLYIGRQQGYIDDAVSSLRAAGHEVARYFVSAGFGLVEEAELLPPYEVTFNQMSAEEIDTRSDNIDIGEDVQEVVTANDPYDIVFLPLGSDYYRAINLESSLSALSEQTVGVVFNNEEAAEEFDNVVSLPARTEEAKEHGTIVVALKGRYIQNFAEHLSNGESPDSISKIEEFCTTEYTTQTGFNEFV